MGSSVAPDHAGPFFQLILCGRRPQALVQIDDDWRALGEIVTRMLFWCGGSIHGCRCEADEMRFAVQTAGASIGAMARHVSGAYAMRLRRLRGWRGGIFRHYIAAPLSDPLLLDDLVLQLHRPPGFQVWTGAAAQSLTWITRRTAFPKDVRRKRCAEVETIARAVAAHCGASFDEMRSASRRRAVSKARVITTVLCTRNGGSVATAASLFHRSRSTLIERAEHYRRTQPGIFADAEIALSTHLGTGSPETP